MKTFIAILLLVATTLCYTEVAAQKKENPKKNENAKGGKGQKEDKDKSGKKDETDTTAISAEKKVKAEKEKTEKEKADKQKESESGGGGNGNAYGKNKGNLSGRDFGKVRSTEAKNKLKAKLDEMDTEIATSERTAEENRKKVADAEAKVEKDKTEKKITEKVYKEKVTILEEAKKKVVKLDSITNAKRDEWRKLKAEFDRTDAIEVKAGENQ
jgi:colicin import membrane protein